MDKQRGNKMVGFNLRNNELHDMGRGGNAYIRKFAVEHGGVKPCQARGR